MRGEFIRGDGLVIPNNVSKAGAAMLLAAALRNDVPTLFAALVKGVPSLTMQFGAMTEPTIGLNGYSRVSIPRSAVGWPVQGAVGNESFVESETMTWAAVGGNFDQTVQRIALVGFNTLSAAHDVFALSVALATELQITPTTLLAQRQFKYRLYI